MTFKRKLIQTTLLSASLVAGQAMSAEPFSPGSQPLGYIGPIELDTADLSTGAQAYRGCDGIRSDFRYRLFFLPSTISFTCRF